MSTPDVKPKPPLMIELRCACSGLLFIEYNTNQSDMFGTGWAELLKLANAWTASHAHCLRGSLIAK